MNDELDLDTLLDDEGKKSYEGKRPVFLQVLCILTFVGTGIAIISAVFSIVVMGQMQDTMNSMNDAMLDMEVETGFDNMYRWSKIAQFLNLFGAVLCLVGALFMWRLRKFGYFIYVFGQALPLFGAFMTFNSMNLGVFGGFGFISMFIGALFPIAFIIMYGLNLKHMH